MIVHTIFESLAGHATEAILCCLALYTVYSVITSYTRPRPLDIYTKEPPAVVGLPKTYTWFFPKLRSRLASTKHAFGWVQEGYAKYHKIGKPFMVHSIDGDMIILPQDMMPETKNLPVNVANIRSLQSLAVRYTFDKYIESDLFHVGMIRKDLTARLAAFTPAIVEELDLAFKHYTPKIAGQPGEKGWQKVVMYDLILKIVARTSHRVFIGEELCREEEYLDLSIKYAITILPTAMLLNCFPKFLWPIIGPLFCIPLQLIRRKASKFLEPVILKRIAGIRANLPESERPNDLMQWVIDASLARGGGFATTDAIVNRVLTVAFAAIHTTSLSATNAIYDLAYLPSQVPSDAYPRPPADILRDEVMAVFPPPHTFNRRYMQRLYNMDAFLKETARMSLIGALHSERLVTAPAGFTTSSGLHMPHGTAFAFIGSPRVLDPEIFERAGEHRYTRFYRGDVAGAGDEEVEEAVVSGKGATDRKLDRYMVTVTDDFPVFGMGTHACPGRFFAASELRILISWFLLNYDVKTVAERPPSWQFIYLDIMNTTAELEIRRRDLVN
ncbi:hypothetical protein DRE_07000 [Drechslerella stenobrocha 248]|uniref:Cytochrome P450 n=1 Tax=Drechslerella stenobrocha 248 TaxID=1043628 RepID=W7I613_9PEZI|nr:hypothetical protein DRE_07000 [Drechslerella stenobrocha 248]